MADGQHYVDFSNEESRDCFRNHCQTEVHARCADGAQRICSLQAAKRCRGNVILQMLGIEKRPSWKHIDGCEIEHLAACMQSADTLCTSHAADFCCLTSREHSRSVQRP